VLNLPIPFAITIPTPPKQYYLLKMSNTSSLNENQSLFLTPSYAASFVSLIKRSTQNKMKVLKKILKWIGYILGVIILLGVGAYTYFYIVLNNKLQTVYDYKIPDIKIPTDSAAIVRGKHMFVVHGCSDCHGGDLSGKVMFDNFILGTITTRNLTKGKNGLPADYSDKDFLRALKHGLNREGKPLLIMPSQETYQIPDEDLADLIAYVKSQAPIDKEVKERRIGPVGYMILATEELPVDGIDHNKINIKKEHEEVSAAFGATLAINCQGCHRANYQGGPPLAPGYPEVPNITSMGRPGKWTEEEFIRTLRTGVRPDGHKLDNAKMPWERFKDFSDVELKALRKFLLSLPGESATVAKSEIK
jgi:mono/diheme cytochrome c family protein